MATATAPAETETEGEEAPQKPRKIVVIAAAVVAVLGAAYIVTSGGTAADAADSPEVVEPGEVVAIDPITLNLADGRFLKVGIALQLVEGVAPPEEAALPGYAAPALDEAISLLGALTYGDLVAPGGRDTAKDALSQRVAERYEDDVMGVYFTELVMQ